MILEKNSIHQYLSINWFFKNNIDFIAQNRYSHTDEVLMLSILLDLSIVGF